MRPASRKPTKPASKNAPRAFAAAGAIALALLGTAGCSSASPDPTTAPTVSAPATTSASAAPSATPSGSATEGAEDACADLTQEEALAESIDEVPVPDEVEGAKWDVKSAPIGTYDPCAALSWIIVTVEGGTGTSPFQILLYHDGEFVGTATEEAYGGWAEVTRLGDATIEATYSTPDPDSDDPTARVETPVRFTWDEAAQTVTQEGTPGLR